MTPREKALNTILSLRTLAEHPNTPPHEAEAARGRIKVLKAKHNITSGEEPKAKPRKPQPPSNDEWIKWMADVADMQRRNAQAKAARAEQAEKRRKAQEDWERKHANSDPMGRPRTKAEEDEAKRDPLGFAAKQDRRTQDQKQADINKSWGSANRPNHATRCPNPETYFDRGGNKRPRNQHVINCDRCDARLNPGEGTIFQVAGRWVGRCCETKPGPRAKRTRER